MRPTISVKSESRSGLGDRVHRALDAVGLVDLSDEVHSYLGKECKCEERRERLNELGTWAKRVLSGKVDDSRSLLRRIMGKE